MTNIFHSDKKNDDATEVKKTSNVLPLLPLRDIIVFPYMVVPLFVGREKSVNALEVALKAEREILLISQKQAKVNNPTEKDIYQVGTIGTIIQLLRLPDGTVKVLIESKQRAKIKKFLPNKEYFLVEVEKVTEKGLHSAQEEALIRTIKSAFETFVKLNGKIPPEMISSIAAMDEAPRLADTVVVHLSLKLEEKQAILELTDSQ